jgi:hypothetical protein
MRMDMKNKNKSIHDEIDGELATFPLELTRSQLLLLLLAIALSQLCFLPTSLSGTVFWDNKYYE